MNREARGSRDAPSSAQRAEGKLRQRDEQSLVGVHAQRLITQLLVADVSDDPVAVLTAAHQFCAGEPKLKGSRAVRQQLALLASSYVHWLKPPDTWTLVGSNEPIGDGFADLVWADQGNSIVIDEFKLATVMRWGLDRATRHQVRSYVQDAVRRWGESFLGVRIIKLSAPALSLLVDPDLTYRPLHSTGLYFPTGAPAMHAPVSPEPRGARSWTQPAAKP